MKLTKSQLKQIIKEEIAKVLRETSQLPLGQTTLTTSDGIKHTLEITDLETYPDDNSGNLVYTIDGVEYDWEFLTGYNPEGAANHIMISLKDKKNEDLERIVTDWMKNLRLNLEPKDTSIGTISGIPLDL